MLRVEDVELRDLAGTVTGVGLRRLVTERRVPFLRVGRFIRFDPREIALWLRSQRVPTSEMLALVGPSRASVHAIDKRQEHDREALAGDAHPGQSPMRPINGPHSSGTPNVTPDRRDRSERYVPFVRRFSRWSVMRVIADSATPNSQAPAWGLAPRTTILG